MAISYIGGSGGNTNNGGDASANLSAYSATAQTDDLILATIGIGDQDDVDFTMAMTTSGYTLVPGTDLFANDTQDCNFAVFYKWVSGTIDSAAVMTGQGGTNASSAIVVQIFRGVDKSTPFDVTSTTATGLNTYTANPPSISWSTANCWVVACGAAGTTNGATAAFTGPTGYTTDFQTNSGNDTSDVTVGMGYNSSPSSPEDPGTFSHNGSDSVDFCWCAATIALRPAITPTPPDVNMAPHTPATWGPE